MLYEIYYRYGELHVVGKISDDTEENREQRRFFIVRLNDFMRQELEGTAVLVFMDESYCHTHHAGEGISVAWVMGTRRTVDGADL